ncbi:hypothetical protein [Amycolatopsis alkalitolerans]|uniref:Uncharacterized protein n=1 Tax=Amycolatopsis alkalitolerans TaxID=2547244 RepID=A0A5C4LZX1_9PSEU|nr:hypothetical protein [Amycolatopsis alkalitolerans]TNC24838.1 hypothetical protein FG385_16450 [Amycolatopsis alkalitolerans]
MTDRDAAVALEVARTADECTIAARAAEFAVLDELVLASAHREELVAMWARLLVTVVPEDLAAELVDELWRRGEGRWLVAVEYFLDYAQRRDLSTAGRLAAEVTSWPWAAQAEFARAVLTTIARALPDGIVPSHYLVARGLIIEAASLLGHPDLVDPLAGLVSLSWHEDGAGAALLAYRELPEARLADAITVLALVAGGFREPDEPVAIRRRGRQRALTDGDDPAAQRTAADKATVLAARAARCGSRGDLGGIEAELSAHAPGEDELIPVLLALALAVAAQVRIEAVPCG